ncbi:transglycosylase domain-containing protein [Rubeoparvulum massiliense]|uniref:transglycosylase domain-containing protein n=1 Tax=Rubeoparvulum massiliense TaxID=1631346 RepID=UPI00065E648A|nr:transglycosylase domain-containing protein [Rubeoparvulum massiliense]
MQNRQSPSPEQKKKRKKRPGASRTVIQVLLLIFFLGAAFIGSIAAGYVAALVKDDPVRSKQEIADKIFSYEKTSFVYFNDGSLMGKMITDKDRRLVTVKDVSPHLIDAIIAVEDSQFEEHNGINLKAIFRATIQEVTNSEVQTGGSTLTQQLVKQTILGTERTKERKFKEIFLALRTERMFSKDQIIEAYMNQMYLGKNANGSNIYGVQAAAKGIFDVDAKDLNLAQAAYIAGMFQAPARFIPFSDEGLENGKRRQELVLRRMVEVGKIDEAQYKEAVAFDIKESLASPKPQTLDKYPYVMFEVEDRAAQALVDKELAERNIDHSELSREEYTNLISTKRYQIRQEGYHIYTTIDGKVQDMMNTIATNSELYAQPKSYDYQPASGKSIRVENALEQVGGIMIDNETGAILGMMGGRDFSVENLNHATQTKRQPGSSIKPIAAYAPALEEGIIAPGMPLDDTPIVRAQQSGKAWVPYNWNNKFHGMMTARHALNQSYNIPAIKLYEKVTPQKGIEYMKKMGITTLDEDNRDDGLDDLGPAVAIGGLTRGLILEEITGAYTTFANQGVYNPTYIIQKIVDSNGNVIYEHEQAPVPVYSPQTAYLITDMLRTVVNNGTASTLRNQFFNHSYDIAGKTGTTNDTKDAWYIGYNPKVTLGVWIGYDYPYPLESGRRPIVIWGHVMKELEASHPELFNTELTFTQPDGIKKVTVDAKSGLLPSELTKKAADLYGNKYGSILVTDYFNVKFLPKETSDVWHEARVVTINSKRYLAKETTPSDMIDKGLFFEREPYDIPGEKDRKLSESRYLPPDFAIEMPKDHDPREEDGHIPAKLQGVQVKMDTESGHAVLSWKESPESDVVGYRVYRSSNGEDFKHVASLKEKSKASLTDQTSKDGHYYAYYVVAVDVSGNVSDRSELATLNRTGNDHFDPLNPSGPNQGDVTGVPSTPNGLTISQTTMGVQLSWNSSPSNEGVLSYNVYYTNDLTNAFQLIGSTNLPLFQHVSEHTSGYYQVSAVNNVGESARSATVHLDGASSNQNNGTSTPETNPSTPGTEQPTNNGGTDPLNLFNP